MPQNGVTGHYHVMPQMSWSDQTVETLTAQSRPFNPSNFYWSEYPTEPPTPEELAELQQSAIEAMTDNMRENPCMTDVINEAQTQTEKNRKIRELDKKLIKVRRVRDYGYRQPCEDNPF